MAEATSEMTETHSFLPDLDGFLNESEKWLLEHGTAYDKRFSAEDADPMGDLVGTITDLAKVCGYSSRRWRQRDYENQLEAIFALDQSLDGEATGFLSLEAVQHALEAGITNPPSLTAVDDNDLRRVLLGKIWPATGDDEANVVKGIEKIEGKAVADIIRLVLRTTEDSEMAAPFDVKVAEEVEWALDTTELDAALAGLVDQVAEKMRLRRVAVQQQHFETLLFNAYKIVLANMHLLHERENPGAYRPELIAEARVVAASGGGTDLEAELLLVADVLDAQ